VPEARCRQIGQGQRKTRPERVVFWFKRRSEN
jgi:hypothetical protein